MNGMYYITYNNHIIYIYIYRDIILRIGNHQHYESTNQSLVFHVGVGTKNQWYFETSKHIP